MEFKGKTFFKNNLDTYGIGLALAYNFKINQASLYKYVMWTENDDYSMKLYQ